MGRLPFEAVATGSARSDKPRRKSNEVWTRELSEFECARRGWEMLQTQWFGRIGHMKFPIRQDLFGIIDAIAKTKLKGETVALQYTRDRDVSTRVRKILASEHYPFLKWMGWRVLVWGWRERDGHLVEREL